MIQVIAVAFKPSVWVSDPVDAVTPVAELL